jgi:hypothetical protein
MQGGLSVLDCSSADCPGDDQFDPIMPWEPWACPNPSDCPPPEEFDLFGPTDTWYDPNVAYGFKFEMNDPNVRFTGIMDFPVGFEDPFTVTSGQTVLGQFTPNQSISFTSVDPLGVVEFSITGIEPLVDPDTGNVFPIKLAFSEPTARFKMRPLLVIDMDVSGNIDIEDYTRFALQWQKSGCVEPDWCGNADFDRDGEVGLADIILFMEYWLWKDQSIL